MTFDSDKADVLVAALHRALKRHAPLEQLRAVLRYVAATVMP
jgi:hypothetical protein